MLQASARRLLAVLLCLCGSSGALAQEEEKEDIRPRIQEIRGLYAKLQEASKGPAPIDRKNKAAAQWSRLRAWELTNEKDGRLRKVVVNSRDASGEVERSFYLKGDSLFFALYVTTSKARKKDEERLYFDTLGVPIRWQHNKDIKGMDGHALRWGEQARSDAKVAVALVDGTDEAARFEPVTCVAGAGECREDLPGNYCTTTYALFPPAGLPVQKDLCMGSPWYAGQGTSCSFSQEGLTLTVTESWQQSCDDEDPSCANEGEETKTVSLTPEMGRVVECPVFGK